MTVMRADRPSRLLTLARFVLQMLYNDRSVQLIVASFHLEKALLKLGEVERIHSAVVMMVCNILK